MNEAGSLTPPASSAAAPTLTGQIAAAELRRGDVLAGRFRIESMLGIGGMGVVYRARDLSLDVDVALKLLRPELARKPEAFERFRQELLLARQVSSAHVVRIHDIAQHEGRWFISMDFVDGESLERRMDNAGRMDSADALPIARGLLEGLAAAHQRGVVHRDLKPANVLLDRQGVAYITDFGVARSLGATGGMTQSGVIFGTPEYLSPEQARGEKVDARSDLYAVGLILYEMLTGTLPFRGGTPAETVMQRIVRQPPSLALARPELPRWLHALCDRLLRLNPAQRFGSAREALQALDTQRVPRPPLNRRAVLLGVLACMLAVGVADLLWRWRDSAAPPRAAAAPQTPRLAVLPLVAAGDDSDLRALTRALDEHLREWLRGDAALAVVPRTRILDALARTVPDQSGAALLRQLPDIARAAAATATLRGSVRRDAGDFVLDLDLDGGAAAAPPTLRVRGADAATVFAAYQAQLPRWLDSVAHPGAPPPLAAAALLGFGRGLLAADRGDASAAAKEFAALPTDTPSALVLRATLDAQEAAQQELPAQATRAQIVRTFANADTIAGGEIHALALSASDDSAAAATREFAQLAARFPHDAALLQRQAQTLADAGADKQASAILQRIVAADDQNARAWFLLGRSSIKLGEAQAAVDDYLVRALVLNTRAGNEAAVAETNNAIGVGYERLGQLDAAVEQYARAAALREKLDDKPALAKTLRNLAIVQAERGDRAAADRALDRVKALLEGLGDRASLADLYNDRGVVAEERGDFGNALKDYRQALALRQQLDLPAQVAESLNNVGYCAFNMGDYDNAGVYWQQALAQYQKLDDHNGALHVEQSMALLDVARGHFAKARARLDASLRSAEDHQLPEEAAVAHVSLADLALVEGRYADAAAAAERAQQIFARRSDQRGQAETLLQQARVALACGDVAGVDAALHALPSGRLSTEQRAASLLAGARRALLRREFDAAATQLEAAARAAAEAHSGALAIEIALEQVRRALALGDAGAAQRQLAPLRQQSTQLGEVPLRLQWLQLELAVALRVGAPDDAAARYREALALLTASGRFRDAWLIHALGERALAANHAEAAAARDAADSARAQLLADAPAALRASLQQRLEQRWRDEAAAATTPKAREEAERHGN